MALTSYKTGILCIANIVISIIIVIVCAIGSRTNSLDKGNWQVVMVSSSLVLTIVASMSLFLHAAIIATHLCMHISEATILKTNFFFMNQILLSIMFGFSSAALLAFWNGYISDKYRDSGMAAGSFGIIATVSHALTAVFSKITL